MFGRGQNQYIFVVDLRKQTAMRYLFTISLLFLLFTASKAEQKDSVVYYNLPDSVKAVQFLAEISTGQVNTREEMVAGIKTDAVSLALETEKKKKVIEFEFPGSAVIIATGSNVSTVKNKLEWKYEWSGNENYKLLIATAADSAGNFSLYSGYIWLPKENKWKLIGSCKIAGRWNTLHAPASFFTYGKNSLPVSLGDIWVQRSNGSWKNVKNEVRPVPIVNLYSHVDSLVQREAEVKQIEAAISSGTSDARDRSGGIYYKILREGTGKQVSVSDTLVCNYKLSLFDGTFVDSTKKPATFLLKQLIKGWQIGLPFCRAGGKIKLVIPSDLGYSIRTRSPRMPPNSILVFEVDVIDVRSPR